jgi:hypothetical protein
MDGLLSGLNTGQLFAMIGGLFSLVMVLFNGFKEKQEGKDLGRKEVREEWQEREAEAHKIIERAEDETIEMVDAVDRNVDAGSRERVRDGGYKLPDYHYDE